MTADNNLDSAKAVRAKIFKILTGESTPPQAYLSYLPGGLAQSEFSLNFLKDSSEVERAYEFAATTNIIPVGVGDWVASGANLWEFYGDWLERYEPPPFSLTPDEERKLEEATDFVRQHRRDYRDYQSAFNNAYSKWYGLKVMPVEDRPRDYNQLLSAAKRDMEMAMEDWEIDGYRSQYDTNYAYMQDYAQRDPVRTKQALKNQLGQPVDSPLGPYYDTVVTPANLLDISWPRYTFNQNETHTYSRQEDYRWGGSASYGALLWSVKAEHEGSKVYNEHKTETSGMSFEFEMLRTPILRPWYSSFLLTSGGWKWPGSTRDDPTGGDALSDGHIPPEGRLPMVPTEAIFVRNLKVKLDMSSQVNKDSLLETKSSAEAGWGPFKIKGNVQTKNGWQSFDFEEQSDGIVCEQPQVLAFFCQLMPSLPNPNWTLWEMG